MEKISKKQRKILEKSLQKNSFQHKGQDVVFYFPFLGPSEKKDLEEIIFDVKETFAPIKIISGKKVYSENEKDSIGFGNKWIIKRRKNTLSLPESISLYYSALQEPDNPVYKTLLNSLDQKWIFSSTILWNLDKKGVYISDDANITEKHLSRMLYDERYTDERIFKEIETSKSRFVKACDLVSRIPIEDVRKSNFIKILLDGEETTEKLYEIGKRNKSGSFLLDYVNLPSPGQKNPVKKISGRKARCGAFYPSFIECSMLVKHYVKIPSNECKNNQRILDNWGFCFNGGIFVLKE